MYEQLYAFIENCCQKNFIDESHGLKHAKSCVAWVEKLLEKQTVSDDERTMAIYSAALHDMCDKKYTEPVAASATIHAWLLHEGWTPEMADALIAIINTMSYSMLKKKALSGETVFPDHGKWQNAYHLARHADLLDAYRVGRCFLYTQHILPNITVDECWKTVEELFEARVFRYVSDGWITMPLAMKFAAELELQARRDFQHRTYEW